jgi:hypothetical protein
MIPTRPSLLLAIIGVLAVLSALSTSIVPTQLSVARLRVWHLLDGSPGPGTPGPYDAVFTDCEGTSTGCTSEGGAR